MTPSDEPVNGSSVNELPIGIMAMDEGQMLAALYHQVQLIAYYVVSKHERAKIDYAEVIESIKEVSTTLSYNITAHTTRASESNQ